MGPGITAQQSKTVAILVVGEIILQRDQRDRWGSDVLRGNFSSSGFWSQHLLTGSAGGHQQKLEVPKFAKVFPDDYRSIIE